MNSEKSMISEGYGGLKVTPGGEAVGSESIIEGYGGIGGGSANYVPWG